MQKKCTVLMSNAYHISKKGIEVRQLYSLAMAFNIHIKGFMVVSSGTKYAVPGQIKTQNS